ncbi:uncharacterized protein B0H18DRAFT_959316 [Fomitopsis serialis]|uniref:uncharacterized protein n=1 Tax=Fomitopsis serialis TaxID=139415 RepID=UPI0020089998|nr:uncharacterized protein B0H18DRAFT_959316 [Neoantrodia serialis]KAH9915512.1 hypothetical protein B0H18DRAFT_959316 [Neoantrodia serialis]
MSASSSSRIFAQHVRVSSTDELSYDPSSRGEINETIHTIVTGRKCWKTMKGKGEVVWPPFLELALVEGLEKYQPVESRTTRAFGRFPMRNKFISDYIFNKTGKRRTPKQVGSRLQQLRDTAEGKRILQQLSSRHIAMMQPKSEPVPDISAASDAVAPPPGPPVNYMTIDIVPDTPGSGYPSPALSPLAGPSTGPQAPRPMRAIDPTVTFISRTALQAYASVRVVRDGRTVWAEKTALTFRDSSVVPAPVYPAQMECTLLYSTEVVPGFWGHLCECGDPSQYAIYQDIVRLPNGTDAAAATTQAGTPPPEDILLSTVYRFSMHSASSPPLSPSTSSVDALSYSHESSPEIGSDYGELLPSLPMLYTPSSHTSQPHSHAHSHAAHHHPHTPSPLQTHTHSLPPLHNLPHLPSPAHPHAHSPPQMSVHHSHSLPQIRAPTGSPATPGLIHRHEEGYASLPPSPLDLTFPAGVQAAQTTLPSLASLQTVPPIGGGMCGGAGYAGYGQAAVYDGMSYTFDPSNTYAGL